MPDDTAAFVRLSEASMHVTKVFRGAKGLPHWGDALPHHPHQTPGMSAQQIEQLHERPAKLRPSQLDWAEVDYFFAHAGYTIDSERTLPPAIRYFLPRLAEATVPLQPPMAFNMLLIGAHLGVVNWLGWSPIEADAIRQWLRAWLHASFRYRPSGWVNECKPDYEPGAGNRNLQDTIATVLGAGLPTIELTEASRGLDEEQLVRIVSFIKMCPKDLSEPGHAALDPWVEDEITQQALLNAGLSDKPWSKRADFLFGWKS